LGERRFTRLVLVAPDPSSGGRFREADRAVVFAEGEGCPVFARNVGVEAVVDEGRPRMVYVFAVPARAPGAMQKAGELAALVGVGRGDVVIVAGLGVL